MDQECSGLQRNQRMARKKRRRGRAKTAMQVQSAAREAIPKQTHTSPSNSKLRVLEVSEGDGYTARPFDVRVVEVPRVTSQVTWRVLLKGTRCMMMLQLLAVMSRVRGPVYLAPRL